ncbi:hypothetical protein GLOIN_2v1658834 [Rhizophagus clarus]|uniref:Uncharacterized protein n=1 Tax=Rhizophagus clarus TaxID=94130 RepID=A0A8H3QBU2_9GLOM|nr:hypothetical protein GLOIN_2v1658834 [Rhizophagus clarus]
MSRDLCCASQSQFRRRPPPIFLVYSILSKLLSGRKRLHFLCLVMYFVVKKKENYDRNIENIDKSNRSQMTMIVAEIIFLGDELRIDKKYLGIQVSIECKITNITRSLRSSTLSIALIDNEKTEFSNWKTLEKWLLTKYKERTNIDINIDQIKFKDSASNIKLVRDGEILGSIHSLVKTNNENIE